MTRIKLKTNIKIILFLAILASFFFGIDKNNITLAAPSDDFVITVKTDNPGPSSNTQFTIPTYGSGYNYNVDCDNDGTDEATGQTADYTCNYGSAGTYTIRIKDNTGSKTGFPRIYFNGVGDRQKLLSIDQWGTGIWTSMEHAFHGCSNMQGNFSDIPNLSNVTKMNSMFTSASVFNWNINTWDTSNVTDMSSMFAFASAFNQDISSWNTSNVTNMSYMFWQAYAFNKGINSWNTSSVSNMNAMFRQAITFNQNIGSWVTGNVSNMSYMFSGARDFNQDIDSWDTSNVTNMEAMFWSEGVSMHFNQDISSWNTGNVSNMSYMFSGDTVFDQNLGNWHVNNVTNMASMFYDSGMSTANYDNTLIGWDALPSLQNNVTLDSSAHYCNSKNQRQHIISTYSWTINDAGQQCIDDFVITVKTDNTGPSSNTQFTIPTYGSGYNYNVDCDNDGTNEATAQTGDYTCNYASAGTYTIRIKDNTGAKTGFPRIYFNNSGDRQKILSVNQWGTGIWTSMTNAFYGCSNLNSATATDNGGGAVPDWATDSPDLSNVTNMAYIFANTSIFNQDIGNWDISSVTDIHNAFSGASAFNQDISSWNTSNVTNMYGMFNGASAFNQDISSWDTSNVISMAYMFQNASDFNQDIGSWDISSVIYTNGMFNHASAFNQDISSWDTGNVIGMAGMFAYASNFNQNIGSWDVSSVTDMNNMFNNASAFNQNIDIWNTANVTDMHSMFFSASAFNQDIGSWDTSNVTDMHYMFAYASAFNENISSWDTDNVVDMNSMFEGSSVFDQNIGSWDTSSVKDMKAMFAGAHAFNQDISSWDTGNVTDMYGMFAGAHAFNQDISSWDTGKVTDMHNMFIYAYAFNQDISSWNTGKVINMSDMFHSASAFDQDLGNWQVDHVTDMTNMFINSALSKTNYDNILIGWNSRPLLQNNVQLDSPANYCTSETQRQHIIDKYNWTINDAGKSCTIVSPIVSTQNVSGVDTTSATGNGNISDTGYEDPERFIEWGTSSGNYTNQCSAGTGGVGNYSCVMTGLTPNTTYYLRAKATNPVGTSHGIETTFTTNSTSTTTDGLIKARGQLKWRGDFRVR